MTKFAWIILQDKDRNPLCTVKIRSAPHASTGVVRFAGKAVRGSLLNRAKKEIGCVRVTGPYGRTGITMASNRLYKNATVSIMSETFERLLP